MTACRFDFYLEPLKTEVTERDKTNLFVQDQPIFLLPTPGDPRMILP